MLSYMSLASLNELKDGRLFQAQIWMTWRILLVVAVSQLVTGATAMYIGAYPDALISFWFGGAIVSFPAFLAGFWWQRMSARASLGVCKPILTLYALSSFAISLVAWPMATLQSAVSRSAV